MLSDLQGKGQRQVGGVVLGFNQAGRPERTGPAQPRLGQCHFGRGIDLTARQSCNLDDPGGAHRCVADHGQRTKAQPGAGTDLHGHVQPVGRMLRHDLLVAGNGLGKSKLLPAGHSAAHRSPDRIGLRGLSRRKHLRGLSAGGQGCNVGPAKGEQWPGVDRDHHRPDLAGCIKRRNSRRFLPVNRDRHGATEIPIGIKPGQDTAIISAGCGHIILCCAGSCGVQRCGE